MVDCTVLLPKKLSSFSSRTLKNKNKNTIDVLVVGTTGREMYESSSYKIPYKYFDLPDDNITSEHLRELMKIFLQYEDVKLYYGKFGNVVKQSATTSSITGSDIFETEIPSPTPREDRFIFEPVFEKVFRFFETQIMTSLFRQTFHENQLARQASRVNAMEEALIHIKEEEKRLNKQKTRLKHIIQNKKQLETIAGFILWDVK